MTEILMMTLTPQLGKIAKKESISSFLDSRARFRFSKASRQTRASGNHNET